MGVREKIDEVVIAVLVFVVAFLWFQVFSLKSQVAELKESTAFIVERYDWRCPGKFGPCVQEERVDLPELMQLVFDHLNVYPEVVPEERTPRHVKLKKRYSPLTKGELDALYDELGGKGFSGH